MNLQPLRDGNIYMFNYFVIFIVLGVFVCANLIVGILVKQILETGSLSDVLSPSNKSRNASVNRSNDSNIAGPAQDVSVNIFASS